MSDHTHIPIVGIVGGIGSGKTSLVRWIVDRHSDVSTINGDEAGHDVLKIPAVQDEIRRRFGDRVFDAHGNVDRRVLGQVVFGATHEQQGARHALEQIVHPRIREMIKKRLADAVAAGSTAVLLDAAVLFEAGWNDLCRAVVYVDVPPDERTRRLASNRGWDGTEITRRESSQLPLSIKRERAQFVVDNSRSIEESGRQLEHILDEIRDKMRRSPVS